MRWEGHINSEVVCDDRMSNVAIRLKVLTVDCQDGRHAYVFNWRCEDGDWCQLELGTDVCNKHGYRQ